MESQPFRIANDASDWAPADGINENYTPPPVVMLQNQAEQPPRTPTEPRVDSTSTVAPHCSPVNQTRVVASNKATASKETQLKLDAVSGHQPDAQVHRPGESSTQTKPSTKKRTHVEVVNVEHITAADVPDSTADIASGNAMERAQPSDSAMDGLAEDIINAGRKKSKMGESEQDRLFRLFHAKLVEFIVDESFIGREPRDRQELFDHLLEMCLQGVLLEDIECDDPQKKRVLKSYSKRLQAWKVTCEQFPDLVEEFAAQPKVLSPIDVLTEDTLKKINDYLGELKPAMHSMPKVLKEAVVWQLLGSVGHRYERWGEGVHKRVAEVIRKNVP
ncbi:hypothetical protein AAVH_15857 [Aphelenchoides avenae]|nr:hypothetical protein AAVH_15857 [Aphelenchus avenae]